MLTEEHRKKIKYLNQLRYLNKEIDRKCEELEYWQAKAERMTSTLTGMPGGHSTDRVDIIVKIIEIEKDINDKIDSLVDKKQEIELVIDRVKDLQLIEILKCRYLDLKTWEEIAYKNNYSWRQIYRLHEKALDRINDVIECQ